MTSPTAQDTRPGETLDAPKLQVFLDRHVPTFGQIEHIRQFRSGYSNLTYLLTGPTGNLVLRRPPFGPRAAKAHDMVREYEVLRGVGEASAKTVTGAGDVRASLAPEPVAVCDDEAILGAPFYLMSFVEGSIIREPSTLSLSPVQAAQASEALVTMLADIHRLPIGGTSLASMGSAAGYIGRQVEGWIKRFERARTEDVGGLDGLDAFLRKHQPADRDGCLVHNDYKFDNVVFREGDFTEVSCVLDWEMCTVGHPLMDFGLSLAYWAHPEEVAQMPFLGMNATHRPGCLRREGLVDLYFEKAGPGIDREDMLYYYVFGNVKIAGIVQQIYARYVGGHTKDARFAQLGHVVDYLLQRARRAVEAGTIA